MPNYNHAHLIAEALHAVLEQSYPILEVIVIDDGSTDDSLDVLEEFARRDPRIQVLRNERNRGANYTLQRLLTLAQGEYVVPPGADDRVLPGFFEKSMALLAQNRAAGVCSTLSWLMTPSGEMERLLPSPLVSPVPAYLPPEKARRIVRRLGMWIQGNTAIYRRQALIDAGGYIPELHSFADGFIATVLALKHGACFIPEPLAAWRRQTSSYSMSCFSDPTRRQEMWRKASELMRTRYQELFPPGFADAWEREVAFEASREDLRRWRLAKDGVAGTAQPGTGLLRAATGRLHHAVMHAGYLLKLAGLVLRHRPNQAVHRRLHRLVHGLRVRPPLLGTPFPIRSTGRQAGARSVG